MVSDSAFPAYADLQDLCKQKILGLFFLNCFNNIFAPCQSEKGLVFIA